MKTSKPLPHRLLALLLALCLTLSLLPTTIGAASVTVTTEQQLKDAYAAIPRNGSGTIVISGTVDLSQRLVLARPVSVTISGGTLRAAGDLWQPFGEKNGPNWCMVHLVDGSLTLQSTTLNANHLTSVLTISGDTLGLTMTDTKIQNGQLDMAGNGPGLILRNTVGGSKTATITNCTFTGNTGTLNSQSSGGAMYVGEGWNVTIGGGTTFSGNTAHSGGAIYCYQGAVNCDNTVRFLNNTAGQRGGAIHSHGDVVVRGSTFSGNSSGQFGGTFYVSANEDSGVQRIGRLVLEDVQITGSSAGNSGGAAYIASMAELYIKGNTSLKGNTVTDGSYESNIMVSSSTGRLIVYGPITGADKSIGVSTANPKTGLELVYSVETARTIAGYNIPLYKMSGTAANYQKFFYDSEVWTLLKSTANADRMSLQTAVAGASQIIFDYNLPGMTTKIHTGLTPGATVTPPSVSTQSESGVTYAFQGWYDAPKGGTKLTGVATAVAGTSVYYAQWKVTTSSTGGGASGTGDMYLIYFDQNYDGGGLAAAQVAAGTFTITVEDDMGNEESFTVSIPFGFPENPFRPGYAFLGWAESPTSTTPVSSSWRPGKTDTLFGIWKADSHTLTWNANGGSGGQITSQDFGTIIEAPPAAPTRNGYTFSGWYQDAGCGILLTAASKVYKDQTFWAKWTPKEYTITWNADYTGGAIATTKQNYDEPLSVMTDPVRDGFFFAGWHTGQGGAGTRAEAYGKVDGNIQFYACWTQRVMDYTVTIDWQDQSDNDALRPEKVTVELLRNGITMGLTYDMSAADSIEGGDKWRRTFQNLAATDNVSSEIAYSVAIASSIPGAYTYKGDFTAQNAGYILMSHDLITVDVDAYVVWDDDQDRDGLRPNKVQLQLLADGQPIPDNTYTTVVLPAGTGDTWGHVFTDMQRYLRTDTGRVEIAYTIVVSEADAGALSHYDVSYSGRAATLEHDIQTVSKQAVVEWNDNNNQDNKRPASMSVQLYADGEPVAGKFVTLSDANGWAYEWTDLPKLVSGGREIVYSAQVTSMLTEYTAASTQMTIEMTYVPLSTTIPVFLTWVDDQDVDGLRPEIVEAELYADGVPTGAIQKLSAANNWSMTWTGYPIHSGGIRIEYTVELTALPNGYEAEYIGIYDQTGLSITLTHDRIRATQTAAVVWDDQDNLAGARMSRVDVMLYADSEPLHKLTATLTEADGWSFDFVDMPVYQGGGQEIQYGIQLISAKGNYTATYEGMTLTLHYAAETMDVPLTILWSDGDNASGTRPLAVAVHLTIDGLDSPYVKAATAQNNWTVTFYGLARYTAGSDSALVNYGLRVAPPDGYAVSIVGDVAVLSTAAETADVLSTLHWYDNDNQYGQRPSSVTVRLLADKHDGKGPQPTGRTAYALAASDYMALFAQMPVNAGGLPIAYSVQVGGNLSMYQITYDGLNVHLTHNAAGKPEYTTDVAAKVVWSDNQNAYHSRPDKVDVGVYANGKLVATYTLDQSNQTETNTWAHTFTGLPTKDGGAAITYTVAVINVPGNYLPLVNGHTVTMTNARNVSVTIRWNDHANADGKRPKEVALNLLGDGLPIGRTIPMTGGSTTETWTAAFEKVPVWDSVNTTHEIAYTYMLQAVPNTYSADYHDYQITTGQPGDSLGFTLDLTHSRELAVVNGTIHWNDGGNRDSLRPGSIVVRLWAKNGNVTTDTGLTQTANGSRTAASWTVSFAPQPVNDREGSPIVYLLKAEAPTGYTVILQDDMPAITFHHEPAQTPGGGGSGGGNTGGGSGGGNTGGGTGGGATGGSSGTDTGLTGDSRYVLAYVKGYPDGSFRPDGNITRAEVAAIVARLSADFTEGMTYGSSATDVAAQSWYTDYVNHCFATGIVKGYPDGTFKPQGAITRAEFATIVARMLDLPATDQSTFADVRGSWAESYIASLTERGIIAGYPDGSFRPDARITRAEAVTMMNRALERNPDKLNLDKLFHDTTFADARKHWAYYDILEASNDHFCGFTAE